MRNLKQYDVVDPVQLCKICWPHIKLYKEQREILYSVRDNDETFVPAGNGLGKDFVSAVCSLWWFLSRTPSRVVTTSVKSDQLNVVLWGEIRRLIDSSEVKLPIQYNHLQLRFVREDGSLEPRSSIEGQVVQKGEALLGRHLERGRNGQPRTLIIFDEASGIDSAHYETSDTWAHRKLVIGNPYPCSNFFKEGVDGGDLPRKNGDGFYRKVIRIKAEHSPNVRYARKEIDKGRQPSNKILVPGVVDWETYDKRRQLWDPVRQSIGLDAEFWEGASARLFPPEWLTRAHQIYYDLNPNRRAGRRTMGVDPAQGGDKTAWVAGDDKGVIGIKYEKTPDTTVITSRTIAYMRLWGVAPEDVYFDLGGGGKQHADRLRKQGYDVNTVGFGEAPTPSDRHEFGLRLPEEREEIEEERYVYKNRRAEMYGETSLLLDPAHNPEGYGLPDDDLLTEELRPIPRLYDPEGKLYLPPKDRKPNSTSKEETLIEIIGHSPDVADALVLMVYGQVKASQQIVLGSLI